MGGLATDAQLWAIGVAFALGLVTGIRLAGRGWG